MKIRLITLFALMWLLFSCSPSKHIIHVEMRYPSKAGVSLENKLVSVVYLEDDDQAVTTFDGGMAANFAAILEQDLGYEEGSIGVYKMQAVPGEDYSSRETLMNLLIDTDADVVFVFDKSTFPNGMDRPEGVLIPFSMTLYCFDGMDKSEKVKVFTGNSSSYADGLDAGKVVANSFKSQWKTEAYSLTYYDSEKWYKPLELAGIYDWKGAMEQWFTLLQTNDMLKRSCAEYNIALACYMLGDYDLAGQWLDRSDADNRLPNISDTLRRRIDSRK